MKTPSGMTQRLVNMGYNAELSAPTIANAYLLHKTTGEPLPKVWEEQTKKDAQYAYNKEFNA